MKINKYFSILLLSALTLPTFMACDSDTDSNPVFHEAPTFVLNEPAYAPNNTYNLAVPGATVQLTCNQPDYGFPVATTYFVQVAFDNEFTEANYVELGSTFNNTKVAIEASELNASLLELWNTVHEGEEIPTEPQSIYVRLRAVVTGQTIGNSLSNVINLPKVLMTADVVSLELPEYMYLAGTMSEWKFVKMAKVYGLNGQYFRVVYLEDGGSFKFGTKDGEWLGYTDSRLTIVDNANAGVSDDGGNIKLAKGGWYTIAIKTAVKNKDYAFTMTISPAAVYVTGACADGKWEKLDEWKFTASDKGTLVSHALTAAGEVRMFVDAGFDWWRTEFTLEKGSTIYYREVDIPDNWATNVGSDYSIAGTVGMVIELDFNKGTGSTK